MTQIVDFCGITAPVTKRPAHESTNHTRAPLRLAVCVQQEATSALQS
jgi:hypothetical protein